MSDQIDTRGWAEPLRQLEAKGLRRSFRLLASAQGPVVTVGDRRLCNLGSNDYLGLANDSYIRSAVHEAVDRWGWGAGASRLVTGNMVPHRQLEARLAAFKRTEAALVCSTGYQANLAAIRSLAGKGDVLLLDKLDHASIIDAAFAGGPAGMNCPTVRTFPHRGYDKLERLLEKAASARRRVIVTDSLFSMDGDFADLPRLVEIKRRYDAILCIDEAHATGVLGAGGRGLAELMGVEGEIDVVVGTLSKALGGMGGFIAASADVIDWLVNTARSFIYTTAVPPAACLAAIAALDIVERQPQRRQKLLALAERLRAELADRRRLNIAGSQSHIIPLIVGQAGPAVQLADHLEQAGFLVPAIRPPTVPPGQARLRISLTSQHTEDHLDALLTALDRYPGLET